MIQAWKIKHGLFVGSNGQKDKALSPEVRKVYRAWRSIKTRCFDKNSKPYKDYGARGITMCAEWENDFPRFLMDVGFAPSPTHSVGRKDNDGNYTKDNCRWETPLQQMGNTRKTVRVRVGEEEVCVAELARRVGISAVAMGYRIKVGYTGEKLLSPKAQGFQRK